jgi:hypothetical protein
MSRLNNVMKTINERDDKVRLEVMRFMDRQIKLYGFDDVLRGFVFALDKNDEAQNKVLTLLAKHVVNASKEDWDIA